MEERNVQQIGQRCRQQEDQRGQGKQDEKERYEIQQIVNENQSGDKQ